MAHRGPALAVVFAAACGGSIDLGPIVDLDEACVHVEARVLAISGGDGWGAAWFGGDCDDVDQVLCDRDGNAYFPGRDCGTIPPDWQRVSSPSECDGWALIGDEPSARPPGGLPTCTQDPVDGLPGITMAIN